MCGRCSLPASPPTESRGTRCAKWDLSAAFSPPCCWVKLLACRIFSLVLLVGTFFGGGWGKVMIEGLTLFQEERWTDFSPQSLIPAYSMQNRYFIGHCNVYFSLNQSRKAGEGWDGKHDRRNNERLKDGKALGVWRQGRSAQCSWAGWKGWEVDTLFWFRLFERESLCHSSKSKFVVST